MSAFLLLVIYATVIATLALTYMTPSASLVCGLDRRWASLYSGKNAGAIRKIQDRHQCCGLHSVLDKAWPFPDKSHDAMSCHKTFDRTGWCLMSWRHDQQVTGGLLLLVAIGSLSLTVNVLT